MIEQIIAGVLKIHTDIICNRVKAKWDNMVGIKGNAEAHSELPKIVGATIVATMEFSGQKAWVAEFGSGSLASKDNPYLDSYVSSANFNRHRSKGDMSIRGRDQGSYTDLDGNPQYSTGHNAGKDLELKPVYTVMYPAHVIQFEVEAEMPEIALHIQSAVEAYALSQLTMETQIYI